METKTYKAALAGGGESFERMALLLAAGGEVDLGQDLELVALCRTDAGTSRPAGVGESVPLLDDPRSLPTLPGLDVLFCLDASLCRELRPMLPESLALFEPPACELLMTIMHPEKLCRACHVDLTQARNMLETVIDEVDEDLLLLDKAGRIVDVNRNVYERRGRTKEDFIGFYVWEALDEEENLCRPPEYDCPLSKTVQTGISAEALYNKVDEDGRLHYYRVYTYPILDDAGELTHVAEIRRDITRRTNLELRLQQSERLAAIGELSTYIAHEIRNPLFAISGFANSLLRNKSLDESAVEKVEVIIAESKRLDSILKAITNFTRPTKGKEGQVDLNQAVRETMDVMRLAAEHQGVGVTMELDAELPLAKGDTELIKQCLINVVKNALEAMPEGGSLRLSSRLDESYVTAEIEDTGVGIPTENMEKIFNPFYSTKDQGAGLGLAMIKKILDDLGGKVELASVEGRGTTVRLMLPPTLAEEAAA